MIKDEAFKAVKTDWLFAAKMKMCAIMFSFISVHESVANLANNY